ncbi:MAG: hypothetical protein KBB54_03960 [Candidatus Pacebacteria bacterium]|nr:hypothetical protein [Candidatus Paceibacterota bacterium]MBP9818498.1 hypothetical protein [Candidatus Paceibacterota bacterium]
MFESPIINDTVSEDITVGELKPESREIEEPLQVARRINNYTKEDLLKFSNEQLFESLNSLRWSSDELVPEEILDAEARIYSVYEPSVALQLRHKQVNTEVVDSYNPKDLLSLKEKWKTEVETDKKIAFIKSYVEKLAEQYGLNQSIDIVVYDEPFDSEGAMWLASHESDRIGVLILYKTVIEKSNLNTILSDISHEMAHAFQESIRKGIVPDIDNFKNDQEWFNVYASRYDQGKSKYLDAFKSSRARYLAIPIERDAWAMQLTAYNEIDRASDQYADEVLAQAGLDTYSNIKKQSVLAKWIRRNLKEDTDPDSLVELARRSTFSSFVEQVESFVSGKNMNQIIPAIETIEEKRQKADELLGLAA